jgi:hypothetical protein
VSREETYLGDGLYASFDGYQIWLKASNGVDVTNAVALEPSVFQALLAYEKKLREPQPNPDRLQKRCPDCFGAGRVDFGDDTPMTCQLCGGAGMLP